MIQHSFYSIGRLRLKDEIDGLLGPPYGKANRKKTDCANDEVRELVFNILKDNWGRWKQHSRTLIGSFMARRKPRVLTLRQSAGLVRGDLEKQRENRGFDGCRSSF
ncbi:hypothetical protein TNCV_4863131 [Trichonephila clavipes]|nr:hypothetical protein TNCV_4863131 [Trichonephila clavipes]